MLHDDQIQSALDLLWRATWQSAVLTLIVVCVMFIARKQIAPRWRVVLWALPLCRLGCLILPASGASLFNCIEPSILAPIANSTPTSQQQSSDLQLSGNEIFAPERNSPLDSSAIASPTTSYVHVSSTPQESQFSPSPTDSNSLKLENASSLANTGLIALFWLWIAGVVGSLLLYFAGRQQLSRILSRAKPLDRDDLVEHILLRRRALGIRRPIACLIIEDEIGPASTGLLRPRILIPMSLLSELSSSQLVSILDHEIHHIRRFDSIYLLLNKLVCCLHWFNPLAYWLATRVRSEMEYAVDAAMTAQGDDQAKKNYGDLLIHLASRRSSSLGLAPMAESQSNLKKRIEELFAPVRNTKLRSAACFAAIVLLIATGLSEVVITQEPTTTEAISSTQDPRNHWSRWQFQNQWHSRFRAFDCRH